MSNLEKQSTGKGIFGAVFQEHHLTPAQILAVVFFFTAGVFLFTDHTRMFGLLLLIGNLITLFEHYRKPGNSS